MDEVNDMFVGFAAMLDAMDDPEAWKAVLAVLLEEFRYRHAQPEIGAKCFFQIGACSHWFRPHQARWTASGGFAWPTGYLGGKGYSLNGLPEFDWSVLFQFMDGSWRPVAKFSGKRKIVLRATVPTRTTIHMQAAIHTLWMPANDVIFYGFRKIGNGWKCVANSEEIVAAAKAKKVRRKS